MTLARRTTSRLAVLALGAGLLMTTQVAPAQAADAVAGAQTAGDSLFPNQGNGGYDVSHYDIGLTVDVTPSTTNGAVGTTNLPRATTTISAATTGAPLSSYSLDFQGSTGDLAAATYNVDTVTVNGVPATFTRIETSSTSSAVVDNHKLVITPATPVSGTFTTVVTTSGAPVIHFDTDGSAEGWNNTTDGATFVNQPVGSMTLFPNNNTPRDKATYTFTVDVPSMLRTSNYASAGGKPYPSAVASNGELVSRTPSADGSRTTWVWNEAKPMASELSMISIGRYDVYESDINLKLGNRTLHEWSFVDPATTVAQQNTTAASRAQLTSLLDFYESKFGPYPGNSTGVVVDIVPGTINYALETQDRPFFPNSAGGSFYHEIAHQWWGDNVSPTDWNDITLNEGPATYIPTQLAYEGAGTSATPTEQAIYNSWNTTSATSATFTIPSAAMTDGNQLFGSQVYQRGAMALGALRVAIGPADFETLMRQYQLTYGGGQITGRRTAAFEAMAESISGRDLTAFFKAWWFTSGKPAWPSKFNVDLAGPTTPVGAGSAISYTLSARNTGRVAIPVGTVITLDASDILDDATLDTLPAGVTQSGTTLSWAVPATALAATSTVAIPLTVNPVEGNGALRGTARAATLGGTCVACTATNLLGRSAISPAVTAISTGTPTVGVPLVADTSGWAPGTTFTYQWSIDGTPVPGATGASWTPTYDVVGAAVTVTASGRLAGSNPTSTTSAPTAAGVTATQTTGTLPTITGTPKIGGTKLVATTGTWEPGTFYTFQWRANGVNIAGATGPTYIPSVATQEGQTLDVVVRGTKAGFTTLSKTSAATGAVQAADPLTLTPTPTIPTTAKVGTPVQGTPGSWDNGVTLTYAWQANGVPIAGATAVAYTPTVAVLGTTLTLTVTGTKPGVAPVSRTSSGVVVEPGTQVLQPTPTITGTPRVDSASTGVPGTWDTGTTRTYQWYVDGVAVVGANALTYTPSAAQLGKVLTFEVTSTRAGYATVVKTSAGQTIVGLAQVLTPTPVVTGSPVVGSTLTADPGTWDAGTTLSYQWSAGATPIAGATSPTYVLTAAELAKTVTVTVTSTRPGYETVSRTSAATAAVAAGSQTSTPVPTISGTPAVGEPLTVVPGAWDAGVVLSYQWYVDGSPIGAATRTTFTPIRGDAGKTITVTVTGTRAGYTTVTRTSAGVGPVAAGALVLTPTPTVVGTPQVGVPLTAAPGTWDDGVVLTYQWSVGGAAVAGATGQTFTPGPGDAGSTVTVAVTGTRAGSTPVTTRSAATAPVAPGDLAVVGVPSIAGTPVVGSVLTAAPGTWQAGAALTYRWSVGGVATAATGPTYAVAPGDVGRAVTVTVTGTLAGYAPRSSTSAATAPVVAGTQPVVSAGATKAPRAGKKLTLVLPAFAPGSTVRVKFKVAGEVVKSTSSPNLTLSKQWRGKKLIAVVVVTAPGYTPVKQKIVLGRIR